MNYEIGFHTTDELIEELMGRKTFMGIVVASTKEHLGDDVVTHKKFNVYSTLNTEQSAMLLESMAKFVSEQK